MNTVSPTKLSPPRTPGGSRRNAGRHPHLHALPGILLHSQKRVMNRLPELVDTLLDAATGTYHIRTDHEAGTTERIYSRPPDVQAAVCLVGLLLTDAKKPAQEVQAGQE